MMTYGANAYEEMVQYSVGFSVYPICGFVIVIASQSQSHLQHRKCIWNVINAIATLQIQNIAHDKPMVELNSFLRKWVRFPLSPHPAYFGRLRVKYRLSLLPARWSPLFLRPSLFPPRASKPLSLL